MKYAAVSAAVFGSALFMAPISPVNLVSFTDSGKIAKAFSSLTVKNHQKSPDRKPEVQKPQISLSVPAIQAPAPVPETVITVAPGDNLIKLAETAGVTHQRLYDANPAIVDPGTIHPGESVRVPKAEEVIPTREMPAPVIVKPAIVSASSENAASRQYRSPAPVNAPVVSTADGSVWDRLAMCESGGNWAINTGNGYYGGLQFSVASWRGVGGSGLPSDASRDEQIMRGQILQSRGGWGNWPGCTAKLGIR